jgi:hypothetical protein
MDIDKFLKQILEEVDGAFPTSVSPAVTKRNFVYGKSGESKGIIKSTPQDRKALVQEKDLNNLIPAFETGFEYLIAAAAGTPLQSRMVSEVRKLQRTITQMIDRLKK